MNHRWAVDIERVSNGYIISWTVEDGEGNSFVSTEIIQDKDHDELSSHEELLWFLMSHFGFAGSKHDPERLRITREKHE